MSSVLSLVWAVLLFVSNDILRVANCKSLTLTAAVKQTQKLSISLAFVSVSVSLAFVCRLSVPLSLACE